MLTLDVIEYLFSILICQIAAFQGKQKQNRAPACLGIWKILLPNFFRSLLSSKARKEREEETPWIKKQYA